MKKLLSSKFYFLFLGAVLFLSSALTYGYDLNQSPTYRNLMMHHQAAELTKWAKSFVEFMINPPRGDYERIATIMNLQVDAINALGLERATTQKLEKEFSQIASDEIEARSPERAAALRGEIAPSSKDQNGRKNEVSTGRWSELWMPFNTGLRATLAYELQDISTPNLLRLTEELASQVDDLKDLRESSDNIDAELDLRTPAKIDLQKYVLLNVLLERSRQLPASFLATTEFQERLAAIARGTLVDFLHDAHSLGEMSWKDTLRVLRTHLSEAGVFNSALVAEKMLAQKDILKGELKKKISEKREAVWKKSLTTLFGKDGKRRPEFLKWTFVTLAVDTALVAGGLLVPYSKLYYSAIVPTWTYFVYYILPALFEAGEENAALNFDMESPKKAQQFIQRLYNLKKVACKIGMSTIK